MTGATSGGMLAALAIVFAPAPGAQAASTIVVSLSAGGCGKYTNPGAEQIQGAIDSLGANGGTILVCPGTYDAFGVEDVTGKLTIKAALTGESNMPVVAPTNGLGGGTIIYILNSKSVTIDGLRVDGTNFANVLTGPATGIRFQNSSGAVQNSAIIAIRNYPFGSGTSQIGIGIHVDTSTTATISIKNNVLHDIETTGIAIEDKVKATTSGNYFRASSTPGEIAVEGIRYSIGSTGSISKNVIHNAFSGIFLYGANKVSVSGNIISNGNYGIYLASACMAYFDQTNNNKITGNTISGALNGILVSSNGNGGCQPHTDGNTISKNLFGGTGGVSLGVQVSAVNGGTATGNKITGNSILAYTLPYDPGASTGNTFSGNKVLP